MGIHVYPTLSTSCMRGREYPCTLPMKLYRAYQSTNLLPSVSIFILPEYREHFFHTHAGCNCLHRHPWLSVWLSHIHLVHVEAETVQLSSRQELQLLTRRRQQITPGNEFKLKFTTSYQCQHECCLWV